jgi:hypothetical protein
VLREAGVPLRKSDRKVVFGELKRNGSSGEAVVVDREVGDEDGGGKGCGGDTEEGQREGKGNKRGIKDEMDVDVGLGIFDNEDDSEPYHYSQRLRGGTQMLWTGLR